MLTIRIDMEMCRVCLRAGIGTTPLFGSITEKFQEVTGLSANSENGLPNALCAKCLGRLKLAHNFRKQSIESENHLHDFIAQVNREFQYKIPAPEEENSNKSTDIGMEMLIESESETEEVESGSNNVEECEKDTVELVEYEFSIKDIIQDNLQESQISMKDECMEIEELDEEIIEKIIEEDPVSSYDEVDDANSQESNLTPTKLKRRDNFSLESHYCVQCDKDFSTRTNLHRHVQTHNGQKPFVCSVCGNGFTQKGSLKQHMHLHTGERPFKCSHCDRSFTQAKTLVNHTRRHTGEKPFTCTECGVNFRQKDGLKRHMLRHLDTPQKVFQCTVCERQLLSKYSFENHMRKHLDSDQKVITGGQKFNCTECSRSFFSQKTLEAHQRAHAGEAPFKCTYDDCEAAFVRHSGLKTHLKRHEIVAKSTAEIPAEAEDNAISYVEECVDFPNKFPCNRCSKVFTLKRSLLTHLKNHNLANSYVFKCDDCKIGFTSKRSLKLHRKNHHQEVVLDLNTCECGVDFVSYVDLVNHINQTHDEIDDNCFFCGEHFQSKIAMSEHILEHEYHEDVAAGSAE
ncbi:gastrula zinc finger protein XlCGF57.1-like [Phlebotomus argentipes]|uniref:gastrula zinc finger protein XlCGF57.1-like n=1 Tax=Phlebotomus argentipes TaxID=94469 RepID=UPI002892C160|nr:gastrula zinc finger protein XlCGF57.1-like [Phlebotomus argentipes]